MTAHLQEFGLHELRVACIHEAAHAVVLAHYGGNGFIQMLPNPNGGIANRLWLGRFTATDMQIGPLCRRVVGLAGRVAELIHAGASGKHDVYDALLEYPRLSATDAVLVGDDLTWPLVARTDRLVRSLWADIEQAAADAERAALAACQPVESAA